jgi:signal transduction histidine kinase
VTPAESNGAGSTENRNTRASTLWITAIGIAAAAFLALATASQTYISMREHGHSFVRILLWQLGSWSTWAIAAPFVIHASGRLSASRLVGLGAILTIVQGSIAAQLALWLQPYVPFVTSSFQRAFFNLWWFVAFVDPLVFAFLVAGGRAMGAYERGKQLELRKSQLEGQLAQAQLDALRLEIQPHFLFNTLNSVAALIRINDNAAALSMLLGLSDLMRETLSEPKGQLTRVDQEMRLIRKYIDLQRARFGDRLTVRYEIEPAAESIAVPTLLLQPLVENALRHGLASTARPCLITIGARIGPQGELRLWVRDDGAGIPRGFDLQRHAGTGLRNTMARLGRLYGAGATLSVQRVDPAGTEVGIVLSSRPMLDLESRRQPEAV